MRADRQYQDAPDQEEQEDQGSSFGSATKVEQEDDLRRVDILAKEVKQQDVHHISRAPPLEKNGVEKRNVRSGAVTLPGKQEVKSSSCYLSKPMSEDCTFLLEWASEFGPLSLEQGDAEERRYSESFKGSPQPGFSSATTIDSLQGA
jgi:hypothetical protein